MANSTDAIVSALAASFSAGERKDVPYRHWLLENLLPVETLDDLVALPFPAPELGGVSGKREVHNATRKYFDIENRAKYLSVEAFSQAFQDERTTKAIERQFDTSLKGSYLRIEYAQDTNGFWLEPHTDLGVKLFTLLLYASREPSHADLGTDIYDTEKRHVGRSPFKANGAMVFVPSDITFHGFEARPIEGVRKSVIVNFVTNDWRAREQLAFPDRPVGQ
ncbi:MAG: 2OG-Fe(II) oxygenase [Hyphomicrobiaceae bacterium]